MKKAILACRVFYREILDIIEKKDLENITVEFLPQGLHDKPDSSKMQEKIQDKIDELEERDDFDYIILAYGYCSGGVEGLKTDRAKLVIPAVHDCIPLLLGEASETKDYEGRTEDRSYFLSRGWIDCGGDVYKQHLYMTDTIQDWLDRFKSYQENNDRAVVDWQENDSFKYRRKFSQEDAEYISFECLKGYESVVLIDNENLAPIHREYAEEKYNFVDGLLEKYRGEGIEYKIVEGDLCFLTALLFPENLEDEKQNEILIFSPGEELKLRKQLLG